jgi:hypothetical protein
MMGILAAYDIFHLGIYGIVILVVAGLLGVFMRNRRDE